MSKWYRTGKVNLVSASKNVVGIGAFWATAADKPEAGDIFTDNGAIYEIDSISSDNALVLDRPYEGASSNNSDYAIIKVISQNGMTRVAGMATEVLEKLGNKVTVSTTAPSAEQGSNGDIWVVTI